SGCAAEPLTVSPNTPSVSTTVVPAGPIKIGGSAHDTASLTGATSDAGSAHVCTPDTSYDCIGLAAGQTPTINTVANGSLPDSKAHHFNTPGTSSSPATYTLSLHDALPICSGCAAEPLTVSPNTPSVSTTVVPAGPIKIGGSAHDTASLTGATSGAGGTVSYALYSNNDCTGLVEDLTPTINTVANGSLPDSKAHQFNTAGTFYFRATYSGDNNNTGPVSSG